MIKHLDLPKQGHLSPPVLRWCASSILVPLQDSTTLARQEKKKKITKRVPEASRSKLCTGLRGMYDHGADPL